MRKTAFIGLVTALTICIAMIWVERARSEEPVTIRVGWVVVPASIVPIMYPKPDVAKHAGQSYRLEATHYAGTPAIITALAAGELEIAEQGFSTIGIAVENAGIDDIRVIAAEIEDGAPGHFTVPYGVLKDSPIQKIEDLKGKVVATNAIGAGADIIMRGMLLQHGLQATRDYTDIEVPYNNMRAMLVDRKIDLGTFILPFVYQPGLDQVMRPLFTQKDALGTIEIVFLTSRASIIAKKRQAMLDFLEDYVRATRWYLDPANHNEAVSVVANYTKLTPESLDSWLFTDKDYYRNPNGVPDLAALQKNVSAQAQQGFLKANLEVAKYADLSLVEEAAKRVK